MNLDFGYLKKKLEFKQWYESSGKLTNQFSLTVDIMKLQ